MTPSLAQHVRPEIVATAAPDGQFEIGKVRLRMAPGMSREDAQRDLATLAPVLRPATKAALAPIVAVLKARTKSKLSDPAEAAFEAEVILTDLAAYPVDVVEYACEYWVTLEAGKWFPSWSELRAICERRVQPRRALEKGLRYVAAGYPANWQ